MFKTAKNAGIITVIAIYCFALGLISFTPNRAKAFVGSNQTSQKNYTSVTESIFCHNLQTDRQNYAAHKHSEQSIKNSFNGAACIAKATEIYYNLAYVQYICKARSFLINYRKADLIFPFHYFW